MAAASSRAGVALTLSPSQHSTWKTPTQLSHISMSGLHSMHLLHNDSSKPLQDLNVPPNKC